MTHKHGRTRQSILAINFRSLMVFGDDPVDLLSPFEADLLSMQDVSRPEFDAMGQRLTGYFHS
jgi:hypothetical protein